MVNDFTKQSATAAATLHQRRRDLRTWLARATEIGQLQCIRGADPHLEIGALSEMLFRESCRPVCLLFDDIVGYPSGWRVVSNVFASPQLAAMTLGLPLDLSPKESVQAWRRKSKSLQLTPVVEVSDGPIFDNVLRGSAVDLYCFPTPHWHEHDGGRYLGTADIVVTQDPETGQLNLGTYRMVIHDRNKLGLYISPGKHGRAHREKYFAGGEPMPVAAAFGLDPLLFAAGGLSFPSSVNEYEWAGAVAGTPVEVVRGPVTGLPIPVDAEIVVEGFVHPDRLLDEGPVGEWTGYYASAVRPETYVEVEALYHRNDPIILGAPPMRPPAGHYHIKLPILESLIWDALDGAGIAGVQDVGFMWPAGTGMLVISLKQAYAGHAKQAALIAAQSRGGANLGRYVVVVDEDIDPHNVDDVLWALWTRSDPEQSLDVIHNCWSTPLDPRIPPHKRAAGDFTNSRLIIDATRPFHWRDQFPPIVATSADLQAKLRQKWGRRLFDEAQAVPSVDPAAHTEH